MIAEHDVKAPDGRRIRARESGDPKGFPIFIHHGTPAAGLLFQPWIDDARRRGLRLVSHDRPGYGDSDRLPGRSVADVVGDVVAIADHLGVDRLATWGLSGGGPHALACAYLLPERVTAVASLASVAPCGEEGLDFLVGMGEDNITEFGLALSDHRGLRQLLEKWRLEILAAEPQQIVDLLEGLVTEVDKAALSGGLAEFFHSCDQIGQRDGIEGWYDDDLAFTQPWGFDLESIRVPVLLWQGGQDLMVPFSHGEWLATRIPGVEARLLDDEGHLSLAVNRVADTHEWLLAHSA
jgi:pimeloyl-ACP methyl ester carboxylesterase